MSHLDTELKKISLDKFEDDEHLDEEDREKIRRSIDTEGKNILEERLQKNIRKTEKMHEHLERKIMTRHGEL